MAATSSGVEWQVIVKPILAASYGSFNKNDIGDLAKAIIKSESEFEKDEEEFEPFYSTFAALCADYISSCAGSLCKTHLDCTGQACRILLKYLLRRLQASSATTPGTKTPSSTLCTKQLLEAIRALCTGEGQYTRQEQLSMTASMKNASLPPYIRTNPGVDKEPVQSNTKETSPKRHGNDLTALILQQLTTPLHICSTSINGGSQQTGTPSGVSSTGPIVTTTTATTGNSSNANTVACCTSNSTMADVNEPSTPVQASPSPNSANTTAGNSPPINIPICLETQNVFISKNLSSLQALRAGDLLLEMCIQLPNLIRFISKYKDAVSRKAFQLPVNDSGALHVRHSVQQAHHDIQVVHAVMSLPILEPLTTERLEKLNTITMACLFCAITHATASSLLAVTSALSPKGSQAAAAAAAAAAATATTPSKQGVVSEEEISAEANAIAVTETALEIFSLVSTTIGNSTRAGGHILQNHKLSGAWLLVMGLQNQLLASNQIQPTDKSSKDEKGKSPSKGRETTASRINLTKVQHGFGVLSVALAAQALTLMSQLLDDLKLECAYTEETYRLTSTELEAASLDVFGQHTALQRVAKVMTTAPLNQLLFSLASLAFRKATSLKRVQKHPPEGDTFSTSDSTTYYEDDFSCSDESSADDDDSEPIFWLWFEERTPGTESSQAANENSEATTAEAKPANNNRAGSIVPDKAEPHGYLALATLIFKFMDQYLLGSESSMIQNYVEAGLAEQQMMILASIIRDLDPETSRPDEKSNQGDSVLNNLYAEFSSAVSRYTHNLLARGILSESLQCTLLCHLGVGPWDSGNTWPLQVYPRTLAVLAQVLLLKPQQEKELACINIWHRLVNTLVESVCNPGTPSTEHEDEDLNVEHAQLVLFLFHSLNLMQKKSVLLLTAGGVIRCSEVTKRPLKDTELLHIARLLLLLEYIVKHLYDAPSALLAQVRWNLFGNAVSEPPPASDAAAAAAAATAARLYCRWKDIEDNYRKHGPQDDTSSTRPRFYSLAQPETSAQDVPKLDGLACNFILGTPDRLNYYFLLESLIALLGVLNQVDANSPPLGPSGLCAAQYCFAVCWRLLLALPPSGVCMEQLASGEALERSPGRALHALVWSPRSGSRPIGDWIKDCLVKQGVYAEEAERMVSQAASGSNHNVQVAIERIDSFIDAAGYKKRTPTLSEILLLDALLSKLQVLLDEEMIQAGEATSDKSHLVIEAAAQVRSHVVELMPCIIRLGEVILEYAKEQILVAANAAADPPGRYTKRDLSAFQNILALTGATRTKIPPVVSQTSQALQALLPNPVRQQVTRWNEEPVADMPCSSYINDAIPSESYILNVIVSAHVSTLSSRATFSILPSLKYLLYTTTNFIVDHILKLDEGSLIQQRALNLLVPMTMDAITDHIHEVVHVPLALEKLLGDAESDNRLRHIYASLLKKTYSLMCAFTSAEDAPIALDEKVLAECLGTMETLLDRASGRLALDEFFNQEEDRDLVQVLLSVSSPQGIQLQHYGTKVLKFFNKLLATYEKHPNEAALDHLCQSFSRLAMVESELLHNWLLHVILGSTTPPTPTAASTEPIPTSPESNASDANVRLPTSDETQENQQLLQGLTAYLVKDNSHFSENVPLTMLEALIPIGGRLLSPPHNGTGFSQLMLVMATLAEAGTGKGHVPLFTACMDWLRQAKQALTQVHLVNRLASGQPSPKQSALLDAVCNLLSYFGSVVRALGPNTNGSSPWDPEAIASGLGEADLNLLDTEETGIGTSAGAEDDESGGEDSDEDSLCNKLCTFTVTQREFMNQHWYHCHTCKMVDGVGVCTVCARVCHRGHDVTYAKYGNFFCDCGAKEDGSCQALVKRSPQSNDHHLNSGSAGSLTMPSNSGGSSSNQYALDQALRRRASSPLLTNTPSENAERYAKERQRHKILVTQLEGSRDNLAALVQKTGVMPELLGLVAWLVPAVESACQRNSPVGCHSRAQAALARLHSSEKRFEYTDQLMLPTLGSQEGAFENVRMNYSGDQGQTIRQLLSAHMIRRVAMCCLSSPHGRRQHLAVSHEKGKITVLQLSALLKQADSSKRKLTLTRLSSAPIPFTVLSVTSNLWNEDFLAVCGLKDCHVLTFSAAGSVADHLVLHPQLETGNFIIRAIWLPGTQTQLALVTADFVKIYDLAKDALSPQYFFLVPSGKIRDVSFLCADDGTQHLLLMSSAGYIYTQTMDEASSARHGPFYVTNTLELDHPDIKDSNGQVCGGGVSIYYSHALQLLFFSYSLGKSFIAPLQSMTTGPGKPFLINVKASAPAASTSSSTTSASTTASGNNGNKTSSAPQPLCQWSEVPNHPGLVCSVLQSSNNPVIMMLRPDSLLIQEIKVVPAKAKIMDMVAIRHGSSLSEHRTTLILLCEDGSLRIYMAAMEHAGFWLSPSVQPAPSQSLTKPSRKKRATKTGKPSGTVSFPIDFFELATPMNDIEFGGNDLLQIYNQQQIKHRLNTTGMYVVSTKLGGFSLEIRNPDVAHVIVGLRVMLGSQDPLRAPSYVEILGRTIPTPCTRNRWFDIPLTREESLQADKRLMVIFGPSQDPENVTIVDSVKVYSKSKDIFGWPEEADETGGSLVPGTNNPNTSSATVGSEGEGGALSISPVQVSSLEKMVAGALQALEGCFSLVNSTQLEQSLRIQAVKLTTALLELPTPTNIELHTKCLLAALCPTRLAYHTYKDATLLKHALGSLAEFRGTADPRDLDAEAFHRLVLTARGVAVARPHNLAKYSDKQIELDETETRVKGEASNEALQLLMQNLMDALWSLHRAMPRNPGLAPVCVPGLRHVEATVHALVDILHALSSCDPAGVGPTVATAASLFYMDLLLCADPIIAFSAKQALVRALRPRMKRRRGPAVISTPPRCSTPTPTAAAPNGGVTQQTSQDSNDGEVASGVSGSYDFEVESVPPMNLLAAARAALSQSASGSNAGGAGSSGAVVAGGVNPIEAMLSAPGAFPPLLDIPPDADDETMVELAIALSLQEHDAGTAELQLLHNELQNLGRSVQLGNIQVLGGAPMAVGGASTSQAAAAAQEAGHFSDTTASAGGSDDEGSTAATDGSTLRTSPAEQPEGGGSGHGSESGGSAADSEHNVSGRSSAYGDTLHEASASGTSASAAGTSSGPPALPPPPPPIDAEVESETAPSSLHALRLAILDHLTGFIPKLRDVGGVRCIPFMQVILMLTADLDGEDERDRQGLDRLLNKLIAELEMRKPDTNDICARAPRRELHLVIMRLLSVLMVRSKTSSSKSSSTSTDHSAYVAQSVATGLLQAGVIDYCLALLKSLLTYWKSTPCDDAIGPPPGGALLKHHQTQQPPDMAPFFLRQYVKGSAGDVFAAYPQLLTEMAFRLPYQVHKQAESSARVAHAFQQSWYYYLCEYMMQQQAPFIRRQVRKLLLFICNNKDKYRQLRDLHALESHMKSLFEYSYAPVEDSTHLTLPYDSLVELIEHLKACLEVATSRTINWQRFCSRDDEVLPFLVSVSFLIDEGVSPTILQLLQCAICPTATSTTPPSSSRKEREKSTDETDDETQAATLVAQINRHVPKKVLSQFIRTFLLETNATVVRWQAHALILAIYKNSPASEQESLLDLMWQLWPQLPAYGRKAAQFVDLLGYFSLITHQSCKKMSDYMEQAVGVLRAQNQLLARHPNASLYACLTQYVELDGYFLESEPCLVCNNPEVPLTNIKLSAIKIDSKFTTTTQIVKLVGSHTISKITLRIADLKRTKMVRTINVYYNNRSVQAVVELKNKPSMWHKAKKVTLTAGQTDVKMEFPLPIVACNLMIEYADFYENLQASTETLQCPRCSASVPSNPGVCANCGENVFQCHKCRAINYDEKDPFLCHACGFCKYAKFDYTLTGRATCAVDPIENDDDRNKTVATINCLLEKADRVYQQLITNKPTLEMLLLKISEHRLDRTLDDNMVTTQATAATTTSTTAPAQVNRAIQVLAQRYCGECKASFEELSKIIQRVLACRRELVAYDRRQRDVSSIVATTPQANSGSAACAAAAAAAASAASAPVSAGQCYGCASAATEHCLTLLRPLAFSAESRQLLCNQGLISELLEHNLRRGTLHQQNEVRKLLCLLTRDNPQATEELRSLLMERIRLTLRGHVTGTDLAFSVRHEMDLLAAMVAIEDSCWEQKLRCVIQLFIMANKDSSSPAVMQSIILPCLRILQNLVHPEAPTSKKHKDKSLEALAGLKANEGLRVDLSKWLSGDLKHDFQAWYSRMPHFHSDAKNQTQCKSIQRAKYLQEKYILRWRAKVIRGGFLPLRLIDAAWLKQVLFNPSSRGARQVACKMIESLCQVEVRKREIVNLLTGFLSELSRAGESASEFLALYQSLVQTAQWKQYLAVRGVLIDLAQLLTAEIEELHRLEETTLTSDLAQGFALKMLTELLASFLEHDSIKQQYKGRLVGAVLNGYLSLRRLVVQRTRLIDETQEKLLELLEEMTTGTEEETRAFMQICIETVRRLDPQDVRTPVFIFERLCSIIYPEENDVGEFFLTLEKDPQQEDFLQGRMLGNPYSSNEPGLGPLMRDVKNKICQDCELVALLEDDNGMELLVNNKIISLDLPVREVFKKVWLAEGGEGDVIRVVYRMRGLLGDATEEFVETLEAKHAEQLDNEEVYRMANVMADCGGLQVMLDRLSAIQDVSRARPLLQVLLKLFRLCVKVRKNQEVLSQPEVGAISTFLDVLRLCLSTDNTQGAVTEQLLDIMETVLGRAAAQPLDEFERFSQTLGGVEHVCSLLTCTTLPSVRINQGVLLHLSRVLAALTYTNKSKMTVLCQHFANVTDFNRFDLDHTPEDEHKLELLCVLTAGIERNAIGNSLKDHLVSLGSVHQAIDYIALHSPNVRPALLRADSDEWKEFVARPSLKYVLRFLTGLATCHEPTQLLVSAKCVPVIHRLEQVSSDEHVGSLAENLLEALRAHPGVASRVEEVREQTRAEKKRLAMAMREKQLGSMGMKTNEKGQVTADCTLLMDDIGDETGLVCVICREGYRFQPSKVLGIYTFTKRCNVEEFEARPRKTTGYSTVTHFNVVHVDCHMAAVRLARARDEWESAALQNANTKCNGLLPLWGPQVPESAFASCLARHNTYLQESTGHRDISYSSTIHDLKLLLVRFGFEKPFHEDTGGGGPQSNMHLIPYILHMALYVVNTTRSSSREDRSLVSYLETSPGDKWMESSWEAEGPLFWATLSLIVHTPQRWAGHRLTHLSRLLVLAHARHMLNMGENKLTPALITPCAYESYRPYLIIFALIDGLYKMHFSKVSVTSDEQWPANLAEFIRHNDESLIKSSEKLLTYYREELIPCTSFVEFCDVAGLLHEISAPEKFIEDLIKSLP